MTHRVRSGSLVGRAEPVGQLQDALRAAAQGRPQLVLIGGDAGVGKTAIVDEATRLAGDEGFTVLGGAGRL